MSRKRVQLSDLDRKKICHLSVEHKCLSQDKLTALLQVQLDKPELARSTVAGIFIKRTKWLEELVAFVDDKPANSDSDSDPSLSDARQQLKGLAVLLADNPQFSAQD